MTARSSLYAIQFAQFSSKSWIFFSVQRLERARTRCESRLSRNRGLLRAFVMRQRCYMTFVQGKCARVRAAPPDAMLGPAINKRRTARNAIHRCLGLSTYRLPCVIAAFLRASLPASSLENTSRCVNIAARAVSRCEYVLCCIINFTQDRARMRDFISFSLFCTHTHTHQCTQKLYPFL